MTSCTSLDKCFSLFSSSLQSVIAKNLTILVLKYKCMFRISYETLASALTHAHTICIHLHPPPPLLPCNTESCMIPCFSIRLTQANVWESMGKPCSCMQFIKSRVFNYKSRKNPYLVLQVTRESVSGTTSHARIRIRYYKSRENPYQVLQVTYAASEHAMKSKVGTIKSLSP